jgi:hypothetical protein
MRATALPHNSLLVHVTVLQLAAWQPEGDLLPTIRNAVEQNPATQVVTLPSHYLPVGQPTHSDRLQTLAQELDIVIMSTGYGVDAGEDHLHLASLISRHGVVVLNRTSAPTAGLDCGVDHPFDVAMVEVGSRTVNGEPRNRTGGTIIGIGMLLNREWECFHGARALMLKQADIILVAGGAAPAAGAPIMALYTRAWENVLSVVLTNPASTGGSQVGFSSFFILSLLMPHCTFRKMPSITRITRTSAVIDDVTRMVTSRHIRHTSASRTRRQA